MSDSTTREDRAPLPEGTLLVGIGLFIAGISAYVFFKIGQQALGQDGFKPIVAMWFIMFALAPGFFLPIEQEISRALAHRRALGQGGRPIVRRVAPLAVAMLLVIVIAIVALAPVVNDNLFEGYGIVTLALLIAMGTYAPLHMARGICSGSGRFGSYGVIIGMDGAIRVIGCAVLWLTGVDNVGPYALTIAFSPIIGVLLVAASGKLTTNVGPPATWGEVTPNLGWLLLGSLFAAALVNAGPITVDLLGDTAPAAVVTRFGNAVIFARIPLFLFQAVQAALLPRLARLAAQRELTDFRIGLRKLMYLVVAVGLVGVVGAYLVGPATLQLVYEGGIDRRTLTLLAFASALYMAALAIAQAVIALHGHATVAIGWLTGFVTYVLVAWLSSDDLYMRVELALVASSLAALLVFGWSIRNRLALGGRPDDESVIEAFAERPLE